MTPPPAALSQVLLSALPLGFDIVAPDGTLLFVSERQEQLLSKDAVGKKCWEVYRDDRSQCEHCPLHQGVAPGETAMITSTGVLGGRTFQIYHTGLLYEGRPAVLEVFHDISAVSRAEERRRSSEAKLQLLIDQVPALLWTVDKDLRFTSSGGAGLSALNLRPGQVVGMTLFEYFGTDDPRFEPIAMHRFAMEKGRVSYDFDWGGNSYEVLLEPLRDARGRTTGCIGIAVDVTERKRSDEALRQSDSRYRAIVEDQTEFIVRWRPDGTRTFVNQAYSNYFGGTSEELVGTSLLPQVVEEDRQQILEKIQRLSPEYPLETDEHRVVLPDGKVSWQQWTDRGIFDERGGLVELQSVGRDITERKQRERALHFTQFAVDRASDAAFWMDADGRFFYVNDTACRMLGYTADELRQLSVSGIDPNFPEEHWLGYWDHLKAHGSLTIESRHRAKDGRFIPVEVAANYVEFDGLAYSIAFARDISERKEADEVLRRSEAKYRGLVEHANYGIYRSSPEGRFLSVNPALVEMLGYDSEEELMAVDMERDVYAHPEERPRLVEQYRESGRIDNLELEWKRRGGEHITVRVSGRPMHDEEGNLEFFEMIVQDVSEQRALEAQLRQAQKMEAIGQLTGGIAHDFNNLLSVITLNAQLVAATLEAEHHEMMPELLDIQEAARKATTMTKQLLGFSRHADLRMVPTDLAHVVTNLSSMMRRVLPESIGIRIDADESVSAVRADAGAVEQILLNLATNARDAMPEGGALRIEVTEPPEVPETSSGSEPWLAPGRYVCIRVRDTGIGMDEDVRSKIFEPFFTTKEPGVGTGLGMAMVYGLTKQHGGFVNVHSVVGQGTTVELYFPAVEGAARHLDPIESLDGVPGGTETILLVEDEDTLRRSAKRVLEKFGYTVLAAADGEEGLELYRAHRDEVDLVVSDLVMPKVGGAQLHRTLIEEGGDVRFLLASGYAGRESGARHVLDPSVPILRKPWALGDLLVRIREELDRE